MSIFDDAWSVVKGLLGNTAPMIGAALGGPLGGIAGQAISKALGVDGSKPDAVQAALIGATPDQIANLKKVEDDFTVQMATLGYKSVADLNTLAAQSAADVNATMQAEAKSEHWVTYSWRPAVGFAVALIIATTGITIAIAYIGAMFWSKADTLQYIPGMLTSMAALLAVVTPILGIAAWFRGQMQVAQTGNNGK